MSVTWITQGTSPLPGTPATVLHQSNTQRGDATGTFTKPLLRNFEREKMWLKCGQDPPLSHLPCILISLSHFHSWMLNCSFLLSFISLFPARGLFLTCQHQWDPVQGTVKEMPTGTKVEPPAPGDAAPHFHSKAPHCRFGTLEEFSLFPEKFKVLGVISCPPGREPPPVALREGRLHPVPQSSVGIVG